MAKITINGNAAVLTSEVAFEDLKKVKAYNPKALALFGGEDNKEEIFRVDVTSGDGSANQYGVSFGHATRDDRKLATMTIALNCADDVNVKEFVAEKYGAALTNLNKVEQALPAAIEKIDADKAAVLASITTVA